MNEPLRLRTIVAFWLPLAATWIMMSVEGPYLSAIVARLGAPVVNLAAYGLAFSLAWLAESPIIMLLTASTALARDRASFLALRRFVTLLNSAVTGILLLLTLPPVFRFLAERLIGLPPEVARLAHQATVLLIPWPAAIGYRRFYQGLLVRNHQTRRVAYGTLLRFAAMSLTALAFLLGSRLPGACIGALALSAGVLAEAAASRWMARHLVRALLAEAPGEPGPSLGALGHFYLPLALTSMIAMSTGPLLTFFMGWGAHPIQCLAAWPVIQSFVFFFRSGGVAFQEVAVALSGSANQHAAAVRRAALILACGASALLAGLACSPLAQLWFQRVLGLGPELLAITLGPVRWLILLPALEYALSYQRCRWILAGETRVVTAATALEAGTLAVAMVVLVMRLGWLGTLAAALALTLGRLVACGYLLGKSWQPAVRQAQTVR